ncbi:MAG: tRNA 4-thiouridine(8) synthase ThiI [Clostridiales bacterium]|nr:tRNA 4-thiouridine(8) synthase ThiI [Clostridiales bacterium]
MERIILIRYGEIHLKGQNRPFFEKALHKNIKNSLRSFPDAKVIRAQGRYYVENYEDETSIIDALTRVFGIVSISPAYKLSKDFDLLGAAVEQMTAAYLAQRPADTIVSFKVESRRADKTYPLNSMDISKKLGSRLLSAYPDRLKVDVHDPDLRVNVEIREHAYIYHQVIKGAGGMPVGTNGKAALLLSGGIDSPVAGYMIAKRGVSLTAIHYHSFPYTSDRSKQKVIDLARHLTRYSGPFRLHIVPFTEIQQELYEKCPDSQLTVLMRRFMMKIAEQIAIKEGAKALITGESIGQVASQTIEALGVTNDAVSLPVFRPLIGLDKVEIMDIAQEIGSYETSILPYEDCCTIFTPKHPVTHPKLERIKASEKLVDGDRLIAEAVSNTELIRL